MTDMPAAPVVAPTVVAPTVVPVVGPGAASAPGRPEGAQRAAVADRAERDLAAVSSALGRLDDGSYGTCAGCGAPLDDALLAGDPAAVLCPSCDTRPA